MRGKTFWEHSIIRNKKKTNTSVFVSPYRQSPQALDDKSLKNRTYVHQIAIRKAQFPDSDFKLSPGNNVVGEL